MSLIQRLELPLAAYWRLLRRYLVPQRRAGVLMAVSLLASTGLSLAGPQVVRAFIDAALAGEPQAVLVQAALAFLAVQLAGHGLRLVTGYWVQRVAWTATNALRIDLASHLVRLDLGYHKTHAPGELIERVDGDVNALAAFLSNLVVELVGGALLLVGILVVIWIESAVLALFFALFALLALALLVWVQRFAPPHWRAERECSARFYGFLGEALTATEDIRACGAVEYVLRRTLLRLRAWRPIALRANLWGMVWMAGGLADVAGTTFIRGVGGPMVLAGTLSLGTLYMIVRYLELVIWGAISAIQYQLEELQHAQASIVRVQELFDISSALQEGTAVLPPGAPAVGFSHVSFGYNDAWEGSDAPADGRVLHDLSFRLGAGRVLGLLGRTGSGKTTISRLLYRFYDPLDGEIYWDGVGLRQVRIAALRARIGLVTQDVQLLRASLRDNLTFYDPAVPDEDLIATLDTLGLARWLDRLPQGLDTPISSNVLSAGEAQLVALARVTLKDPDLVILDEAASRLDPATEALLGRALDRLLQGRSAVIIAHRLSTVERADDVLILEDGREIEYGPRRQLAADPDSQYARLLRTGLEEVLT